MKRLIEPLPEKKVRSAQEAKGCESFASLLLGPSSDSRLLFATSFSLFFAL